MRALDACGDGFWEFDLVDGSAWFSEWFYRKLNWMSDVKRTLPISRPVLPPTAWDKLMDQLRAPSRARRCPWMWSSRSTGRPVIGALAHSRRGAAQ